MLIPFSCERVWLRMIELKEKPSKMVGVDRARTIAKRGAILADNPALSSRFVYSMRCLYPSLGNG